MPRWYIAAAVATSCTLSCLGALSIILSYLLFPSMRAKQGRQLLFYLSWADLFSAIVCASRNRSSRASSVPRHDTPVHSAMCVAQTLGH